MNVWLPFFTLYDYDPNDINVEDVHFLLWRYLAEAHNKLPLPDLQDLEPVTLRIYDLFNSEFERAPVNDNLKAKWQRDLVFRDYFDYRQSLLQNFIIIHTSTLLPSRIISDDVPEV